MGASLCCEEGTHPLAGLRERGEFEDGALLVAVDTLEIGEVRSLPDFSVLLGEIAPVHHDPAKIGQLTERIDGSSFGQILTDSIE